MAIVLALLSHSMRNAHADAARGAYLAAAAGCDGCHTAGEHKGEPYAGGRLLKTEFGTISTPNITPDPRTGIGAWSRTDFERAMRWGIPPDGSRYVSTFPYLFYNRLSGSDLDDLWSFLRSLPPVVRPARDRGSSLALLARTRDALAVMAAGLPGPWRPDPTKDQVWNRGAYLVATVGRCGDCHTPRTWLGAPDPHRFLAGVRGGRGGDKVPDITSDRNTGIGKWSISDIVDLLTTGATPDGDFVGGAMAEIVKNTSRLNEADRRAIAVYLLAIPARPLAEK